MPVATGSGTASLRSMRSAWLLFSVLGLMLSVGALPARAGYDWCSVDPTITLDRTGGQIAHAMDLQVMVPRSILPMAGTARLGVIIPSNVTGTELLNTSTPIFNVKTTFTRSQVASATDSFRVKVTLRMPQATIDYPVRLVILNQDTGQIIVARQGMASQMLTLVVDSPALRELVKDIV